MAIRVIGRIPADYTDGFGDYAPTENDLEMLDEEISKRLPDGVSWCGNELLAKESNTEVDIEAIIDEAYDAVFKMKC